MVTFRMFPRSTVYPLLGWIMQNAYVSFRLEMFLKSQLWQNSLPHTIYIGFLQNVCFIYSFSSERILSAGSSLLLTESKPCAVVQSLAGFHLEWLKKMWDLPIVWSLHQAEGVLPFPCNPKPTSISWMQVLPGWLTVKRAQHWAHLSIAECVQFRRRA